MGSTAPVKTKCWLKFLKYKNCTKKQGSNHSKWKCPGCHRSVIFDRSDKEIPFLHVKTNLRNMNVSVDDFKEWAKENC